jgi:hypothetical protein
MIRPLRVRHRWMTTTLAVALPLGFAAAMVAREPHVTAGVASPGAVPDGPPLGETYATDLGPFGELPLEARFGRRGGALTLELTPTEPLRRPELVVYWSPAAPEEIADELPQSAVFLGVQGDEARRFPLPSGAASLLLFDLGRGELVAVRAVPEPRDS